MSKTRNVEVRNLRPGDVVLQEDFHRKAKYEVEIVSGPEREERAYGVALVFQGKIVRGPNRLGDVGNISYGESGLAKLVRAGAA